MYIFDLKGKYTNNLNTKNVTNTTAAKPHSNLHTPVNDIN